MLILTLFGLGMVVVGLLMLINPLNFSKSILIFSEKNWFHSFEITSRLSIGLIFIYSALQTNNATLFYCLGTLLCLVSLLLVIIGPERHKNFARRCAQIGYKFRYISLITLLTGGWLIYLALS